MAYDKTELLQSLQTAVETDLKAALAAQADAQAGATHEQARPENSKDTRALEQSYLARGLAQRVGNVREALAALRHFVPRRFTDNDPIGLGAVVVVESEDGGTVVYWVTPAGGGYKLHQGEVLIRVVTRQAPLGRALLGKHVDDEVVIPATGRTVTIRAIE